MFDINYIEIFKNIPPQWALFFISMLPIAELRVAIPLGLTIYKLDVITTFIYSVAGNLVPMFFILYLIDPVSQYLMKHSRIFNKFFTRLFEKTRIKFSKRSVKYGSFFALVLFVAIPLPLTGCWTGSLAAFLFQIPKKYAILAISLGVIIAGIIVTILTTGVINFI